MARPSYRKSPVECLIELQEVVMTENVTPLARGTMFYNKDNVIVTDDVEDEYIPSVNPPVVVDTEYAQELSWLFFKLTDQLFEVVTHFNRATFVERLADAANRYLLNSGAGGSAAAGKVQLSGLLCAVLLEASLMTTIMMQDMNQVIRDELTSSAAALSDLADRI